MASVVDKLRIVLEEKKAIKAVLDEKGKEPTDKLNTYAGLISELDNEEQVSYVLKTSNGSRAFAQLSSKQPVKLTATPNDIRLNTSAITNTGYTDGEKVIPGYQTRTGMKLIQPGSKVSVTLEDYDFTHIHAMLIDYNTSINNSTSVYANVVMGALYEAKTTNKLSDITKDDNTQTIDFGITAEVKSVLRYFTMKED